MPHLYDASVNTGFNSVKNITSKTMLKSSADVLGSKGADFWFNFKLEAVSFNLEEITKTGKADPNQDYSDAKGKNLLNFQGNIDSPLRLFAIPNPDGGYYQDRLLVRSNRAATSAVVGTIFAGETYDIELYVSPSAKKVDIYFNGEFITTRTNATYATGTEIRFLDGPWGEFNISELEFVSCGAFIHEHTDKYSAQMGIAPHVIYGDETLTYNYVCNCGELLNEGIGEIYADEVAEYKDVKVATAIKKAASVKMTSAPYWVSAKVYAGADATAVYSYGKTEIVGIANGVYTINGVATDVVPSGVSVKGDYDVVSIRMLPADDKVEVFINGFYVGGFDLEIADAEKFNILLGGAAEKSEASLTFKYIKIVSLAQGANGKVSLPICNHEFGYRFGVIAELTPEGIVYKCKYCEEKVELRTVTIGDGAKEAKRLYTKPNYNAYKTETEKDQNGEDKKDENGNLIIKKIRGDLWIADLTEYKDTIFAKSLDGTFFITFNVNASSLGGVTGDTRKSFVSWTPAIGVNVNEETGVVTPVTKDSNGKDVATGYEHLISLKKIDGKYVVVLGADELDTAGVMELNKDHNFIFEIDSVNSRYYAYMDGQYLGSAKINIELSGKNYYPLRVNNNTGVAVFTDFQIFKPETDKEEDGQGGTGSAGSVHHHFPDVTKEASKTISVKNGVIKQTFVCTTCGEAKEVTRNTMNNIVEEKLPVLTDVKGAKTIQVGNKLNSDTEPYIISFDFSASNYNLSAIIPKGSGASLLATVKPDYYKDISDNDGYNHLLRAFAHTYVGDEKKGYTDNDGDRYADDVIDLRASTSKSAKIIATVKRGETVNITYVVNPATGKVLIYVKGTYVHNVTLDVNMFKPSSEDVYIRVTDGNYGSLNFKNFKLVRMTDECKHVGPACDGSAYVGKCNNCDAIVEVVHNYTAQRDMTGKWIKYTCACGATYVAFDDMAIIADLKYTNKYDLLAYLAEKYYPIFR